MAAEYLYYVVVSFKRTVQERCKPDRCIIELSPSKLAFHKGRKIALWGANFQAVAIIDVLLTPEKAAYRKLAQYQTGRRLPGPGV